jgi:hypothetical protein
MGQNSFSKMTEFFEKSADNSPRAAQLYFNRIFPVFIKKFKILKIRQIMNYYAPPNFKTLHIPPPSPFFLTSSAAAAATLPPIRG